MDWPRVMWYLLQKSNIFLDLKEAELSVMSFWGHPNLDSILFSRNEMMTKSVACLEGMDSIHLLKYEASKVMQEFHARDCGGHLYWKTTAEKILRAGFY